jgi:hypothetical protein
VAVTTPGWPRLAAQAQRLRVATLQGQWRTARATGTFAYRSPHQWVTLAEHGGLSEDYDVRRTLLPEFERGDYCTPAGPVRQVEHSGRPAWQVDLVPPPHKRGLLTLVLDRETGLLLKEENATGGHLEELFGLSVDAALDDAVFAAQVERELESARDAARYELARRRPVPTPQWFPWRRGWFEGPELRVVEDDRGVGSVGRAPRGQPAPVTEWPADSHVHRLDHRGWSWAVASERPMSAEDARRVVEQVVDL